MLKHNQDPLVDLLLSGSTCNTQYDLGLAEGKQCILGKTGSKVDFYYYVPILKNIESLLKNQDILAEVKNGH